ncbi:MAG: type II toxin-antitoxin system RelE/ParE family toxin [Acetatifactor sp.]|nr:type II toxin-antitoxin system RelE/ParE family toxin [Acetatifactor sp.]
MSYKIQYSAEALKDLDEIWEYILWELCNPDAAERVVTQMLDAIDALKEFPRQGPLLSSVAEVDSDYRFVISGNYMAFYRIVEKTVYVDRILYQGREYMRILFGDVPKETE